MQKTRIGRLRLGRLSPGRPRSAARGHRRSDMRAEMPPERLILRNSRQTICSRATGSVLEVGIDTGLNLRRYPEHVALTALDLDQELPSPARRPAAVFHHALLLQGDAAQLPFPWAVSPPARSPRLKQCR